MEDVIKELFFSQSLRWQIENKKLRKVFLTDRDLEIINFILDMKFLSVQNVFEKFFKITNSGTPARSDEWAVSRLQQLAKGGFLKSVHSFSEKEKYYIGTQKGYYAVRDARIMTDVMKPIQAIDHRTFYHDRFIVQARIMLENRMAASCWVSDKQLRSNKELAGGLSSHNVPDGVYTNEFGKRIAFELEYSKKSQEDYRKKIKKYLSIMRSPDPNVRVFEKVLYVCEKESIAKFLSGETRIYGDLFEIKRFTEFFP